MTAQLWAPVRDGECWLRVTGWSQKALAGLCNYPPSLEGPRRGLSPSGAQTDQVMGAAHPRPHAALPPCTSACRPLQAAGSSEHPLVVVSTPQVDDWDESSSFLMERRLQALPRSGIDLMSAERRGV